MLIMEALGVERTHGCWTAAISAAPWLTSGTRSFTICCANSCTDKRWLGFAVGATVPLRSASAQTSLGHMTTIQG